MMGAISAATTIPKRGVIDAPLVQTKDLTKRYGNRLAVDILSMTVRREEMRGCLRRPRRGDHTVLVSSHHLSAVDAGKTATREIRQELIEEPE